VVLVQELLAIIAEEEEVVLAQPELQATRQLVRQEEEVSAYNLVYQVQQHITQVVAGEVALTAALRELVDLVAEVPGVLLQEQEYPEQ
jgi:hypothetical protein